MAYPRQQHAEKTLNEEVDSSPFTKNDESTTKAKCKNLFNYPFYDFPQTNRRGNGGRTFQLQVIHTDPDIYVIPNFFE